MPVDKEKLQQHRLINWLQSAILLGGMLLVLAALGWIIGGPFMMVWTVIAGALLLVLGPRLSPHLILAMYQARRIHTYEAPQLYYLVDRIAGKAGLSHAPTLFYVPSRTLNAFTVGNRREAAIAVTDGLLRNMGLREIAGVLAHEVSHISNNDMWVMGLADLVSRITSLLSLIGMLLVLVNLPLILFSDLTIPWLAILLLILAPTVASLLQFALSRTREHDADLDAVEMTGDPHGLASALEKLERSTHGLFERIMLPGRRVPDPSLLRTHPPTEERIRRLLSYADRHPGIEGLALPPERELPLTRHTRAVSRPPRWRLRSGYWG